MQPVLSVLRASLAQWRANSPVRTVPLVPGARPTLASVQAARLGPMQISLAQQRVLRARQAPSPMTTRTKSPVPPARRAAIKTRPMQHPVSAVWKVCFKAKQATTHVSSVWWVLTPPELDPYNACCAPQAAFSPCLAKVRATRVHLGPSKMRLATPTALSACPAAIPPLPRPSSPAPLVQLAPTKMQLRPPRATRVCRGPSPTKRGKLRV